MVLDQIDDKRIALRVALKKNRVVDARDILADIDKTEAAVQAAIRELAASEWGARLRDIRSRDRGRCGDEVSRFLPMKSATSCNCAARAAMDCCPAWPGRAAMRSAIAPHSASG
jgi:hypothetical protein